MTPHPTLSALLPALEDALRQFVIDQAVEMGYAHIGRGCCHTCGQNGLLIGTRCPGCYEKGVLREGEA